MQRQKPQVPDHTFKELYLRDPSMSVQPDTSATEVHAQPGMMTSGQCPVTRHAA